MTEAQLEVRKVSKRFGGLVAIDDCSFRIEKGRITGLIGPNGAGKTTTFSLIAGEIAPDSGAIVFEKREIQGMSAHAVARLGLRRTFQIPRPLMGLSVLENLMLVPRDQFGEKLGALVWGVSRIRRQEEAIAARAREVLEPLELAHLAEAPASTLSGGQKKLLELARCLMAEPSLILLDEPTAGVNPRLINDLVAALRRIHDAGVTLAIVEHNMNVVMSLCDRIVVLDRGHVLAEGSPKEIQRDRRVLEAYLGVA